MVQNGEEKPTHTGLDIRFFGWPEYRRGSEALPPLATRKAQSLLAYLIVNRQRPHSRDRLATLFWGDRDDAHARRSLATALWHIRRLLGEDCLLVHPESVQFNPACPLRLDVAEFETLLTAHTQGSQGAVSPSPAHLVAAVELYRGDFLEGFYDDWCIEERYRLEALYVNALSQLVAWHEACGDVEAVLACARRYLACDPLAETIHLAAMRALVALGDWAGARRQWQSCCDIRQRELHLPPSPEMLKEAESILGAMFIVPLPAEPLPVRGTMSGRLERPPLVGRATELGALLARWKQAVQGRGGMVLIAGEAGIGKTRLAEEFAAVVRGQGGWVGRGRCHEPERMLPYQPLAKALRDLAAQDASALKTLPAWARTELARLVPEWASRPIQAQLASTPSQAERQAILLHAIATSFRHLASHRPLLIVLDDLHWATDSTIAALDYMVHQLAGAPALLVGTCRLEEVGEAHALTTVAAQLAREGLAQHLMLERLSTEAVTELVRRALKVEPESDFVTRLCAHTDGNPYFTIETLRTLTESPMTEGPLPVPDNVRTLIASRLQRLSAAARDWIACAAAAGRGFDLDLICRALDMDESVALEAADELLRHGFLREGVGPLGPDYEFVHHLVQEVTYAGIHHRRRRRLHRLLGEAVEGLYDNQPDAADALAYHFDLAGETAKALRYHGLAAQQAAVVFAWQKAETHYTRMLQLLEQLDPHCADADSVRQRGQVFAARAELRFFQARLAERDADLAALAALAEASDNDHLRLQAEMRRAQYLNLDAEYGEAIATAERSLPLADRLGDVGARCYLLSQIGFAYYFLGRPQQALEALESALAMIPEADRETRRHITHILGYVHFHLGDYARSLAYQQQALASHQAYGDYNGMAWAGLDIGAVYQEMGQLEEAGRYLTEHLDLARRIGARSAEAYGLIQCGALELSLGNYVTAGDLFQQALAAQRELRTEHGRVAAELGTGFARYHLGDVEEARRWLTQAVERARSIRHRRRLGEALIGLGLAEISAGRPLAARDCLTEAVALARDAECKGNLAAGLAALARAERQSGDSAQAMAHASEAVSVARDLAAPAHEMWAEMEAGLTLLAQGEPGAAAAHTERAVSLAPQGDESWIGTEQVHRAHAQVLRALGHVQEAAEQERRATSILEAKADRIPDPQQRRRFLQATQ